MGERILGRRLVRSRKRGRAVAVRAYNHHLTIRLTYYEARVLADLFDTLGMHHDGTGPDHLHNPIDQWEDPQDRRALKRVRARVEEAGGVDQAVVREANMVKRLKRLRAKKQAAGGLDHYEQIDLDYLEHELAGGPGAVKLDG